VLLYYITDRKGFPGDEAGQKTALLRRIGEAARAGVDYIQLREKDLDPAEIELLAREALHVIHAEPGSTRLLINTHVAIALSVGADGVHLPANATSISSVREKWQRVSQCTPLIGVSAHSPNDVHGAQLSCASFAVLAPIFEKVATHGRGIGLQVLREACSEAGLPVFALGGVNLDNAEACLGAGPAGIAGIRLFQQGDLAETVRRLRAVAPQLPLSN
jgi:thiamine-phosphate pyrophosphorylase